MSGQPSTVKWIRQANWSNIAKDQELFLSGTHAFKASFSHQYLFFSILFGFRIFTNEISYLKMATKKQRQSLKFTYFLNKYEKNKKYCKTLNWLLKNYWHLMKKNWKTFNLKQFGINPYIFLYSCNVGQWKSAGIWQDWWWLNPNNTIFLQ